MMQVRLANGMNFKEVTIEIEVNKIVKQLISFLVQIVCEFENIGD
jgi:hypothetical protein